MKTNRKTVADLRAFTAFEEFSADVASGAYQAAEHMVPIADKEFEAFLERIE